MFEDPDSRNFQELHRWGEQLVGRDRAIAKRGVRWRLRRAGLPLLAVAVAGCGIGGAALATQSDGLDPYQEALAVRIEQVLNEQCRALNGELGRGGRVDARALDRAVVEARRRSIRTQADGDKRRLFSAVVDPGSPKRCDSTVEAHDPASETEILNSGDGRISRVFIATGRSTPTAVGAPRPSR